MRSLTFRTIIEKDGEWYHGYVPALPGCHTQGKTVEEARKNLRETIVGYLKVLKDKNLPIPEDHGLETFETINTAVLSSINA